MPTPEEKRRLETLAAEIAALDERLKSNPPELETEQLEWEAKVHAATGGAGDAPAAGLGGPSPGDAEAKPIAGPLPPDLRTILALEPTERTPEQRAEIAAFFRPLSPTLAAWRKERAAKEKERALLRRSRSR